MRPAFLLVLFLSSTIADPYNCSDESHAVVLDSANPSFSIDSTLMDINQNCFWNITFPMEYAAEVMTNCWNCRYPSDSVRISSSWPDHYQGFSIPGSSSSYINDSIHVMWPPTFIELSIGTQLNTSMIVAVSITIKPMSDKVFASLTTAVNQQPCFLQYTEWPAETAITVQSLTSGQLHVAVYHPNWPGYSNIFVYKGSGDNRQFTGTLGSLFYRLTGLMYISKTDILTFYRAMDDGTVTTVIVNDYENVKNVAFFQVQVSSDTTAVPDTTKGLSAITVVNDASGPIYLTRVDRGYDNTPIKLLAGGMIRDYDTQGTLLGNYRDVDDFDDRNYPQFLSGIARTFLLEEGDAVAYYTSDANDSLDSDALDGRNGFVMSNNYPFKALDQNSQDFELKSVDGNVFTFEYTINEANPNPGAYLNFSVKGGEGSDNFIVDLHNITTPATFNLTALEMTMNIVGGNEPSNGTYIPYKIHSTSSTMPTTTTTKSTTTAMTTTSGTSTAVSTPATTTAAASTPSTMPMASWKIVLISLGILLFFILIVFIIRFLRYRIRRGKYRKFWSTMSGVLPIAVKVDEWELGDKQLEIFEDKELGRGAFGIVYEGELYGDRPVDRIIRSVQKMTQEEKEQKRVAVKRLPLNAEYQARSDFLEEINFMKKLGYHPHILGMIGCVTAASMPLIVLDYCGNGDLLSWVRKNKYSPDLTPEQFLSIAWQISDGLCYLKSLNLIHRDLAARNILLTEELVAKISDFGLCRRPENTEDSATYLPNFYVSRGGRLPVKWLAPESLRDFQFSFKTDLWSYGVILWEMYTFGDIPFGDINPLNLFELLNRGERLPQGAIPDPMYELMSGCWDAIPGKRTPIEKVKEILHEMLLSCSSNNYGYLTISPDDGAFQWAEEETKGSDQDTQEVDEI